MRSLWCGFSANFCMECCRGFYMLFFVGAKRYLGGESKDLALWKRSLAGAFAGVASWVVVYPLDVVKTAVQAQNPQKGERTSTREMALRLYRDGGIGRFYRGLGFTVLRGRARRGRAVADVRPDAGAPAAAAAGLFGFSSLSRRWRINGVGL